MIDSSRALACVSLFALVALQLPAREVRAASPASVAPAHRDRDCRKPDAGADRRDRDRPSCAKHVLLISVDGMHAVDLERFIATHPRSALATLARTGVRYTDAHAPVPTDSFPGLLALVTGGHPASTGVYYEVSYDRSYFPPASGCTGPRGTVVAFDESIDIDSTKIDGGGGINPASLTQRLVNGSCRQVFPHDYLRVNDAFEVVKAFGGRTAWSDKEQSYEILNGPSGHGVDDLYDREIAAGGTTGSLELTEAYDDGKVAAILNEIDGKSARGVAGAGVPALFGMNFQAVSVGQKLAKDPTTGLPGGYVDAAGTPGTLLERALEHTDASLERLITELDRRGLARSTTIVVSAKHGQQPIDRTIRRAVSPKGFGTALASELGRGFVQTDDLALVWLTDRSDANEDAAQAALRSNATALAFERGVLFTQGYEPPGYGAFFDPRTPDFSVEPDAGVIYTGGTKVAEHGGFRDDDTHVALLVARVGRRARVETSYVQTAQVAPTILEELGIDGRRLDAVRYEGTRELPGVRD